MSAPTEALIRLGCPDYAFSQERPSASTLTIDVNNKANLAGCMSSCVPASLSSIIVAVPAPNLGSLYDPLALASFVPYLRPNSTLSIHVTTDARGIDLSPVSTSFLLAGLGAESETRAEDGSRTLTARKTVNDPSAGQAPSSVKLNLPIPRALDEEKKTSETEPVRIKLGGLSGTDDDGGLIDEDELLGEETGEMLSPPPAVDVEARAAAGDDCGGRKACDNCSCGRAEREAAEKAGEAVAMDAPKQAPTSSCGNCAKGDAFRCASCPYLGMPAFKPGEEHLVLNLTDDI